MTRLIVLFALIIFYSSCSNRTSVPNDIIQPDSMRNIMREMIEADAYSDMYLFRDTAKHDKLKANQDLLEAVFKIHHISRDEFKKSLSFYESRPDLSMTMFDSLSAYASIHRNDLYRPSAAKITAPIHPGIPAAKPNMTPPSHGIPLIKPQAK